MDKRGIFPFPTIYSRMALFLYLCQFWSSVIANDIPDMYGKFPLSLFSFGFTSLLVYFQPMDISQKLLLGNRSWCTTCLLSCYSSARKNWPSEVSCCLLKYAESMTNKAWIQLSYLPSIQFNSPKLWYAFVLGCASCLFAITFWEFPRKRNRKRTCWTNLSEKTFWSRHTQRGKVLLYMNTQLCLSTSHFSRPFECNKQYGSPTPTGTLSELFKRKRSLTQILQMI